MLLIGLLAPAAARAAPPDPRFGIVETFVNPAAAAEAGAGYTRIILRWDVIQPASRDDWKPANVPDPLIEAELAAGRQVVAVLIGTPAWAAINPADGARAVPDMDAWAAFTRRMAEHYRGRIGHWIIWNEPDVWEAGHPGQTWAGTVEDYARLLKTAYLAIKGTDPTLQVHMAGLTYFWDWSHGRRRYLDRLLEVLATDPEAPAHAFYFDAVIYHLYFNPSQTPAVLAEARASLARYGLTGKELWINETNAPPSEDPQEPPWSKPRFKITLEEQAAFVLQEFSLAFASGASRVEFYKLRNTADHPESIEPYGLLRGDDSRRPAFTAYRVATTYLAGFKKAYRQRVGETEAVTFDRGDRTTTVLWTTGRRRVQVRVQALAREALLVDERGTARPIRAVNGVYVVDLPGAVCSNNPCIIGGAPRLLVEAAAANGRLPLAAGVAPRQNAESHQKATAGVEDSKPVRNRGFGQLPE
ncbi:MAG: hypothetical protein N2204_06340 [Anaerolineae bacterium]|nr:hypothetical protein [Anaerolineae bacterium]